MQLLADYDKHLTEIHNQYHKPCRCIRLGVLASFTGPEISYCLNLLRSQGIDFLLHRATHEELFDDLRQRRTDLIISDQRRAFSSAYVNITVSEQPRYITLSRSHPLVVHQSLSPKEHELPYAYA